MKDDNKHLYYLTELSDYKIGHKDHDITGWNVKDSDNRVIGKVDNLLVNKEQERVVYLDIAVDHSIIEANHDPYGNPGGEVREFINKEGENHIILPIGLVELNTDQNFVYTNSIDYKTFAETKRYESGTNVSRDYEVIVLDSYNRNNDYDRDYIDTEDAVIDDEPVTTRTNRFDNNDRKDRDDNNTSQREFRDSNEYDESRAVREDKMDRERENLKNSNRDDYQKEDFVDARKSSDRRDDRDYNSNNNDHNYNEDLRDDSGFSSGNKSDREKELERELELEKRRRRELENERDLNATDRPLNTRNDSFRNDSSYRNDVDRNDRDRSSEMYNDEDENSRSEKFRRENDEAYERAKAAVGRKHDHESHDDYDDRVRREQRLTHERNDNYDDYRNRRYNDKDFYERKEFEGRNFRRDS